MTYRYFVPLAALTVVLALAACATNPVTGEQELMLMTESQEIATGQDYHEEVIGTYGVYDDPRLQDYVTGIGLEMAALSHRPNLPWHFTVLDTPVVNAFAVPGGYIYLTRGILAHMNSKAELAMVVGHEIGHVTARHSAKAYTRQMLFAGGLLIGSLASDTVRKWAPVLALGAQVLFLKYSRDQERQSDDLGVEYAYQAGYDPREFDDFFRTLDRMKEESGGGLGLPNFLSTHPVTANRIVDVEKKSASLLNTAPSSRQLVVAQDEYLNMLDGLVYGDDPRQGYVKGDAFVHPDLGFSFNYPDDWDLDNTPKVVQIAPSSGDAMMQLAISNAATPRDAFDSAATDLGLNVIDSRASSINGLNAYIGIGEAHDDDETYVVEMATISLGNSVYAFMGMTTAGRFGGYRHQFERTFDSFQRYSDSDGKRALRVQVVTVPGRMSVERFLGMQGVSDEVREQVLIINALHEGDVLEAGRRVKVLR